ncbi:MAG: extracellular solute-binding protein [Ruminococcus sp.]|nr:extracellular solute-binding protein [Ruminococcus sp.]
MMKSKRLAAGLLAVLTAFSVAGCGSSDDSTSASKASDDTSKAADSVADDNYDFSHETVVSVEDTSDIEGLDGVPDEEKELVWLSYFDINPTRANPEIRTDLDLFQKKGGSIKYDKTNSLEKYTKLADEILAGSPPDMFWYEGNMTFPYNVTRGMFQSVDKIIDFDSDLWKDVKELADTFVLNGEHYVAPINLVTTTVLTYDKDLLEAAQLDDPYELWKNGEWNWNTWEEMMSEFVNGATGDEVRYGVYGWFAQFIYYSTGETLIKFDSDKQEYYNNIDNPDLERAAQFLYDLDKKQLNYHADWIGDCAQCFNDNVLFYAMGPWASSADHTPKDGASWGNVPIPSDPTKDKNYIVPDVNAYMWVAGSKKDAAMKIWNECAKIVYTDDKYKQIDREKFNSSNPNWTEEMYEVAWDLLYTDYYTMISDPCNAINTEISDNDAATNDSKKAVARLMYDSVMESDEDGAQYSWTQLKEMYKPVFDRGIKEINDMYKKFLSGEKIDLKDESKAE